MVIAGIDPDPLKTGQVKEWATPYWKAVYPYDLAGAYTNFMMGDEGEDRIKISFGDNYPRLKAFKQNTTRRNCSGSTKTSARPIDDDASCLRPGPEGFGFQQRRPSCLIGRSDPHHLGKSSSWRIRFAPDLGVVTGTIFGRVRIVSRTSGSGRRSCSPRPEGSARKTRSVRR
jgi:hypothetical protein